MERGHHTNAEVVFMAIPLPRFFGGASLPQNDKKTSAAYLQKGQALVKLHSSYPYKTQVISMMTNPPVTMNPPPRSSLSSGICLKTRKEITWETTKKIAM